MPATKEEYWELGKGECIIAPPPPSVTLSAGSTSALRMQQGKTNPAFNVRKKKMLAKSSLGGTPRPGFATKGR